MVELQNCNLKVHGSSPCSGYLLGVYMFGFDEPEEPDVDSNLYWLQRDKDYKDSLAVTRSVIKEMYKNKEEFFDYSSYCNDMY